MEKQVLSIEQMQELIAMGIDTSKSHLWWYYDERTIPIVVSIKCNFSNSIYIPTFTLQDILEMLPKFIDDNNAHYHLAIYPMLLTNLWFVGYDNIHGFGSALNAEYNEDCIIAAFNILKWCKENNYI